MSKSPPPSPASDASEDFSIEIDPSLIAEALAAVDRRLGPPVRDTAGPDAASEVEVDLEPARPARPAQDDEGRRLQFRVSEQAEKIRKLEAELARAAEARELADKQLRDLRRAYGELTQDFERFRGRSRKDVEEAERRGEDKAIRPLVDVYDNVERAWLHAVSDPAQLLGGLQMIVEQFKRLMNRFGLERVDADRGVLFDPACHEAVLHVCADEVLPGTIVEEVQAGFRLRGRLFRPARVTVSAPPPDAED